MNWRLVMAINATLLLSGCGHDGDESGEQAELTGLFQAGNVSGVRYQTPTREGITDTNGTFKYLAGETVTFSIGGIRLGAVPGASAVTPFTLAGMTPPTTEPALRRELDRASRTTSNFVRAVNIQRLLLALDADHDPASGIDVHGRESVLSNATISFDQSVPRFAFKLEKLAPNLTHNLPHWFPIVHLYRSLGITVPAHAPVQYDSDDDMFFTRHSAVTYYPDGSRESEITTDSLANNLYSTTYVHDSLGRITARRLASQSASQYGFMEEERWTYDARGTVTANVRERDEGADGSLEFSTSVVSEFDAYNNLLRQVMRQDNGNDGSVDWLHEFRATYDASLNPVLSTSENDAGADGTIESRSGNASEYDALNRLSSQLLEWDGQNDGIVDSRERFSITYGIGDRGESQIYERDEGADDVLDERLTYRWTYDSIGVLRMVNALQEQDSDADGVMDTFSNRTMTYDRDGRILSEVQAQHSDFYTDVPVNSRQTSIYADHGGPLRMDTESDVGADGDVDARYTTEYEYGAGGELLSMRNTSDRAPFGAPMDTGSTQVMNVLMTDGVRMLAQQYFEFWYSLGRVSTF